MLQQAVGFLCLTYTSILIFIGKILTNRNIFLVNQNLSIITFLSIILPSEANETKKTILYLKIFKYKSLKIICARYEFTHKVLTVLNCTLVFALISNVNCMYVCM